MATIKQKEMIRLNIPLYQRSPFIRWSQRWGVFKDDEQPPVWVEYGPLERHQKVSRTMDEMWQIFQVRKQ